MGKMPFLGKIGHFTLPRIIVKPLPRTPNAIFGVYMDPEQSITTNVVRYYHDLHRVTGSSNLLVFDLFSRTSDPPNRGVRGGQFHKFYFFLCFCVQMHKSSLLCMRSKINNPPYYKLQWHMGYFLDTSY